MVLLAAVETASYLDGCGRYNNNLSLRAVETVLLCAMKTYERKTRHGTACCRGDSL